MTMLTDDISSAFLLSFLDFFLSFIFISFIGVILHFLPYINKLGEIIEKK